MTKVLIYTDFDGTITKRSGNNTVFTEFYQSLLIVDKSLETLVYKNVPMKSEEEVHALFEERFGKFENVDYSKPDAEMLMSPEAVAFFHDALKHGNGIKINIITKNRADYIRALFKYQGFSPEEIGLISIMDTGHKYGEVNGDLHHQETKADCVYVLDDTEDDFLAMMKAVRDNDYTEEQIRGYHKAPGSFTWGQYQKDLEQLFDKPVTSEEITQSSSEVQKPSVISESLKEVQLKKRQEEELKKPQHKEEQTLAEVMVSINTALEILGANIGKVEQHHFRRC